MHPGVPFFSYQLITKIGAGPSQIFTTKKKSQGNSFAKLRLSYRSSLILMNKHNIYIYIYIYIYKERERESVCVRERGGPFGLKIIAVGNG